MSLDPDTGSWIRILDLGSSKFLSIPDNAPAGHLHSPANGELTRTMCTGMYAATAKRMGQGWGRGWLSRESCYS